MANHNIRSIFIEFFLFMSVCACAFVFKVDINMIIPKRYDF